jgi:hypothetical protein
MSDQTPELSEAEAERLSLIRYQLLAAEAAVIAPPPINNLAINIMQDVVESALGAAGDHIRAEIRHRDFDKLFDAVVTKLGSPTELVGLRAAAIALNNARVGFKHHGNQVRDETLRRHYDVAATLVNELVVSAFRMKLASVSLLLFIKDDQVRGLIEDAERIAEDGDIEEALFRLRLAFDLAVKEYELRKTVDGWHSIFETKPPFFPSVFDLQNLAGNRDGGRHLERIVQWIDSIDNLTRHGALGIDTQRYAYFNAVSPAAIYLASDHPTIKRVRFENPTQEHFRASHHFVIDSAIRLATNDYTLKPSTSEDVLRDRHFNPDYVSTSTQVYPSSDSGPISNS